MNIDPVRIADNYRALRARVDRLGGPDVGIVAVTKTFPIEAVRAVHDAGCPTVGENYAQELVAKFSGVAAAERPEIHFIGQLQSNKVRSLAPFVSTWQTVDRASLVDELARRVPAARILVQVDLTGEPGKGGCTVSDLDDLTARALDRGLLVAGLMVVGPTGGDPDDTRRCFRTAASLVTARGLTELSMGMSGDWEMAVDEGSTLIRVGSAIFGDRPPIGV